MLLEGSEQLPVNEITCTDCSCLSWQHSHKGNLRRCYNCIIRGIYISKYNYYLLKIKICISGSAPLKMQHFKEKCFSNDSNLMQENAILLNFLHSYFLKSIKHELRIFLKGQESVNSFFEKYVHFYTNVTEEYRKPNSLSLRLMSKTSSLSLS